MKQSPRRTFFFALNVLTLLLVSVGMSVAHAQEDPATKAPMRDTLPVETALMYDKLLNIQPDYAELMNLNPATRSDPKRFGNDALMKVQESSLRKIYDDFKAGDTVMMVKKRLKVIDVNNDKRLVAIDGLTPDEPFVYALTDTEQYGVFLRNAKDVLAMAPPYEYDEFYLLAEYINPSITFPAEIIVQPVVADTQPFPMADGSVVKPILADIVEITLLHPDGQRVALVKRFNGWSPEKKKPSLLDLKDNPIQDAMPSNTVPLK